MSKSDPIWIVGHHATEAVVQKNAEQIVGLHYVPKAAGERQQSILQAAQNLGIPCVTSDKKALAKQSGSDNHQGIAVQVKPKREMHENELDALLSSIANPLLLILDQVQDPHNFGACLRTADAAGVNAVIVAKDNAAPLTPVVHKVASGATQTMPIFRVTNLVRCMQALQDKGVWMIGTSDKASQSVYQQNLTGSIAIVMGAEGKGLRNLTEKNCDALVSLPMAGDIVTSLNVSVATGVALFEAVRQRQD